MDYRSFVRPFTIGAVLASLVFLIYQFDLGNLLSELELKTYDLRFKIRGTISPQLPIVIVNIDQDSFDELNLPWPWPRDLHALLIQKLAQNQVKLIALDVLFVEPKADPREDTALAEAIKGAGTGEPSRSSNLTADGVFATHTGYTSDQVGLRLRRSGSLSRAWHAVE